MFVHNIYNKIIKPETIQFEKNLIKITDSVKLLGMFIDEKLNFETHVTNLSKSVNSKLYALKRMFMLSNDVKLKFFKSFILPMFDFSLSLFVYYSGFLINKIEKLYNTCLKKLFNLNLSNEETSQQNKILSNYNLMAYKYRVLYRFSILTYRSTNGLSCQFMNNLLKVRQKSKFGLRSDDISSFIIPKLHYKSSENCLSFIQAKFVNNVLKNTINLPFNLFKQTLLEDFDNFFL